MIIKLESISEHSFKVDIKMDDGRVAKLKNVQLAKAEYDQLKNLTDSIVENHMTKVI